MDHYLIYQRNNDIYLNIIQHMPESSDLLLDKIKKETREESEQDLLDFLHLILKHARSCSLTSVCASHLHSKALIAFILQKVSTASSNPPYPLIICMIDLVKNDPTILTTIVQQQFLQLASPLWHHESIYVRRKSMELCSRMIPYADNLQIYIDNLKQFINQCQKTMTKDDLKLMCSDEYTEFFYNTAKCFDRETIKIAVHMTLKILLNPNVQQDQFGSLKKKVLDIYKSHPDVDFKQVLFDICCANDDDTVFLLDTVLAIGQLRRKKFPMAFIQSLGMTEHYLFLYFLYRCGNTHDIIIDLLLGNECSFLDYLTRYAAHASRDILFVSLLVIAEQKGIPIHVDIVLDILAKTILVLAGDGFPYDARPLIKRLMALEDCIISFWDKHFPL